MRWLFLGWTLVLAAPLCAQEPSDRDLYLGACAACHRADGTGFAARELGFDTPVPDFTDCAFATPEADADWFAIVHQGGPARAFDRRMPAFGEALSDAEIQRILDYLRGFCADTRWPRGELNLPRALVTEKAFPENEAVWTTSAALNGAGSVQHELLYERRLGARTQFELIVPFASHETADGWQHEVPHVAGALKRVLFHDRPAGRILSVAAEAVLPSGIFEPFVAYGQMLPSDSFVQAQAGAELPHRGDPELFWRAAAGRTFVNGRFGRSWSPMIELLASRELEAGAGIHWDAVPQLQVSLSRRQHILVNAGVRLPVNARAGRSTQVITYFLWDWFDGGLLEGWR
jgi:hypothetical protein